MKLNGKRVRELLEEKGMTEKELGIRTNLTKDQLGRYVLEEHNCSRKALNDIADVLDVDWLEIVKFAGSYY